MPKMDNPAGRLHDLLERARKLGYADHVRLRMVWGALFEIDPKDTPQILAVTIRLFELTAQTRKFVGMLDGVDRDLYVQPVKDVEIAFASTTCDSQWVEFKTKIKDTTMTGLAFCSDTLSKTMHEEVIEQETLDDLKAEVDKLIDEVLKSDMDATLKAIIIDHLEGIRRAIIEYRIRGTAGLRQALDSGVGSLMRHLEELKKSGSKPTMVRLMEFFGKVNDYVSVSKTMGRIYGQVSEMLQLGV